MESALPSLLFFDPDSEAARRQRADVGAGEKPKREKRLFCAACRHPVTHQDERIQVHGGHEHRFANPQGIHFHIGCFREAAGCLAVGAATPEFTWFAGYAWRIALCAHCRAHLGWRFEAPQDYFHGLIIDRLTSAGPSKIP
jgi:hypothetical protein